jgi:hypothetical protein
LTHQEIAEINALGFCWDSLRIRKLKKTVADLAQFKAEHGHCNVPARNDSLGQRCRTLREIKENLPPDIIAELNVLGFCWDSPRDVRRKLKQSARDVRRKLKQSARDVRRKLKQSATELAAAALWDKTYAELVAYWEIHGHCNVPASNGPLGVQCTALRCRKARLTPEQITKLDALGFCWDPIAALWDKAYAALVTYKEIHGDCNVPQASGSLGIWCNTVRSNRKKGTLSTEQIARLDAIGFCWDPLAAEWGKNYAELVAYKEAHGHLRVSRKGSTLGNW